MSKVQEKRIPNFLILLSFVEMWERFSYYGMRALLVLYLTSELGFQDAKAYGIYGLFASVGYAGCIVFGWLADKFFGPKYLVFIGGTIMLIGHTLMALGAVQQDLVYFGLSCIAVGTSAFKGNITNMLGMCYEKRNMDQSNGYVMFYVAVNIGAFLASAICGTIGAQIGWHYGFGLAGIGMAIGLIALFAFNHILEGVGDAPDGFTNNGIALAKSVLLLALVMLVLIVSVALIKPDGFMYFFKATGPIALAYYLYVVYKSDRQYRINLLILGLLLIFYMIFYALEMQTGGIITIFADRNVDLNIFGYEVSAAGIDGINPLTIMIFGAIIGITFKMKDVGGEFRFLLGLACIPLCFIFFYIGGLQADRGIVQFWYFLIGMMLMAIGEIFVGPYIQTQASVLAPKGQRGFIFGFTMLSLTFSNVIGAMAAQYMSVESTEAIDNPILSLGVYQAGFEKIIIYNLVIVALFLLLIPVIRSVRGKISR